MRCFIAAWPDQATRRRLEQALALLVPQLPQARPMQPRNLHLTLAFIGSLDEAAALRVADAAAEFASECFEWNIDALGWFGRARVAWASGAINPQMGAAVARARTCLDRLGIEYDRKPFVPHVTLFRNVRRFPCSGPLAPPLPWRTAMVALYAAARDADGPVYRRIEP
ncbi:MAG TPA: RNA 2',3'-cyclic phosphodiesterase [Burkholderiaceae bacterium]|nr:RNA 2',3'-cyclic phosphodiesterase [Burkholderiaceae bacterium]